MSDTDFDTLFDDKARAAHAAGPSHRRGDGTGLRLLDATHGHAHVVAFGDHDHATRVDAFHQRVGHLLGEPLLHLRTACVQFSAVRGCMRDAATRTEAMSLILSNHS